MNRLNIFNQLEFQRIQGVRSIPWLLVAVEKIGTHSAWHVLFRGIPGAM